MKREEIEQLLAEYVNGKISAENKQLLENLFAKDAALKQEAADMLALWQMMDNTFADENKDDEFYDMLAISKQKQHPAKVIYLQSRAWLYATAVAACIAVFFAGRFTASPIETIKYKTLIVKQQVQVPAPIQQPNTEIAAAAVDQNPAITVKPKVDIETPSALAQQLRSVYASERIAAVMSLSGNKNINPADLKILEIALREDANPNVKLTIINVLQPLAKQQNVQNVLIRALNTQEDATTQSSLIDVLANTGSKQALPQMIALLDNKNTSAMVQDRIRDEIKRFAY